MDKDNIGDTKLDIFLPKNILKILLCAIFVFVCIWSMIEGFAKSEIVNAVVELRSETIKNDFRVYDFEITNGEHGSVLTGKLENISRFTYIIVIIDIEIYNSKKELVVTCSPLMRKIEPGDTWNVSEIINAEDIEEVIIIKYIGTRDMKK